MARPRKAPQDRKDASFGLRLTAQEMAEVESRAASLGVSVTEYFRRKALGHPMPPSKAERLEIAALTASLLRLGVNLNQVAKHMNAGRSPPPHLPDLIATIAAHVERLSDEPRGDWQGPQL